MLYNYKEAFEKYKNDYNLKKALVNKEIYKIDKGLYSDNLSVHYLSVIVKKYPFAIISGHSAYYYYNLTDIIPREITVCTNRNATRIHNKEIKQIRMKDELYYLGITTIEYEGIIINIYDKERMLIDLIRNKNHMGYDLYKEIIANYREISDSINMRKIEEYLPHFVNADKILEMLQDEVF